MTLTRKHFEAIAKVLREHHPGEIAYPSTMEERECTHHHARWWRGLVASFANLCADANPLFDSERFTAACYPEKLATSWGAADD